MNCMFPQNVLAFGSMFNFFEPPHDYDIPVYIWSKESVSSKDPGKKDQSLHPNSTVLHFCLPFFLTLRIFFASSQPVFLLKAPLKILLEHPHWLPWDQADKGAIFKEAFVLRYWLGTCKTLSVSMALNFAPLSPLLSLPTLCPTLLQRPHMQLVQKEPERFNLFSFFLVGQSMVPDVLGFRSLFPLGQNRGGSLTLNSCSNLTEHRNFRFQVYLQ